MNNLYKNNATPNNFIADQPEPTVVEPSLSIEDRRKVIASLTETYSIYLYDHNIDENLSETLTEFYEDRIATFDDDDLMFMDNEGIFSFSELDKFKASAIAEK